MILLNHKMTLWLMVFEYEVDPFNRYPFSAPKCKVYSCYVKYLIKYSARVR
jgi:hypothetical protein